MDRNIPRDVQEFLLGYPNREDDPSQTRNLQFYSNQERCQPDELLIDDLHAQWGNDFDTLEYEHGYIQWLFPIREYGMNYDSQPLQPHEAQAMRASPEIMERVKRSYKTMLSFYGMTLLDEETGLIDRSPPPTFQSRYRNLVRSPHNYLRISRILKSLSELGLEHLNAGLLLHVLYEQSTHDELNTSFLRSSMDRWWANCIRNDDERLMVNQLIEGVRTKGKGFTREKYEELMNKRKDQSRTNKEDSTDAEDSHAVKDSEQSNGHVLD